LVDDLDEHPGIPVEEDKVLILLKIVSPVFDYFKVIYAKRGHLYISLEIVGVTVSPINIKHIK